MKVIKIRNINTSFLRSGVTCAVFMINGNANRLLNITDEN